MKFMHKSSLYNYTKYYDVISLITSLFLIDIMILYVYHVYFMKFDHNLDIFDMIQDWLLK